MYRLTPPPEAGGAWTYTTLYSFPSAWGSTEGRFVLGGLVAGAGGALFGVTADGGYVKGECIGHSGCGTVFSLAPPAVAGGQWTEQVIHSFVPGPGLGFFPEAGLVIGPGGVLYGTTSQGGEGELGGTAYSLTPPTVADMPVTVTVLHSFGVSKGDGGYPETPLVLGPNGVLYGTTGLGGGACNCGTVFELAPPASPGGSWTERILHTFTNGADGGSPSGLTLGPDGTLYGTTETGGTDHMGTAFAVTP